MLRRIFRSTDRSSDDGLDEIIPSPPERMTLGSYQYAALDVETTGLFANGHDRIVEIGIVLFTLQGGVQGEFESVLNPGRDLGPQHIHGLTMADLSHAPSFELVCGDVASLLANRVIVGHNSVFDVQFLTAEFQRAGVDLPELPHICTMRLATHEGQPSRLSGLCTSMGITNTAPHTAMGDARATAEIFTRWYRGDAARTGLDLAACGCRCEPTAERWTIQEQRASPVSRSHASALLASDRTYLATLIDALPATMAAGEPNEAVYLDLLERALEDRHVSADEAQGLVAIATQEGLSADATTALHSRFFAHLTEAAWANGSLSDFEASDLKTVAGLLGVGEVRLGNALEGSTLGGETPRELEELPHFQRGTTVCFTGTLQATILGELVTRAQAYRLALDAGLTVLENVTKRLDVLVVADPLSASGKAKKARAYGTRIVAEAVFWHSIGARFD